MKIIGKMLSNFTCRNFKQELFKVKEIVNKIIGNKLSDLVSIFAKKIEMERFAYDFTMFLFTTPYRNEELLMRHIF